MHGVGCGVWDFGVRFWGTIWGPGLLGGVGRRKGVGGTLEGLPTRTTSTPSFAKCEGERVRQWGSETTVENVCVRESDLGGVADTHYIDAQLGQAQRYVVDRHVAWGSVQR